MRNIKIIKKPLKINSQGFTLIELILTVIAIGVFGGITANILAVSYTHLTLPTILLV